MTIFTDGNELITIFKNESRFYEYKTKILNNSEQNSVIYKKN